MQEDNKIFQDTLKYFALTNTLTRRKKQGKKTPTFVKEALEELRKDINTSLQSTLNKTHK